MVREGEGGEGDGVRERERPEGVADSACEAVSVRESVGVALGAHDADAVPLGVAVGPVALSDGVEVGDRLREGVPVCVGGVCVGDRVGVSEAVGGVALTVKVRVAVSPGVGVGLREALAVGEGEGLKEAESLGERDGDGGLSVREALQVGLGEGKPERVSDGVPEALRVPLVEPLTEGVVVPEGERLQVYVSVGPRVTDALRLRDAEGV